MKTSINFNQLSSGAKKFASKLSSIQAQAIDEFLNSLDAGANITDGSRMTITAKISKAAVVDTNAALTKIPAQSRTAATYTSIYADFDMGWRYFVEMQQISKESLNTHVTSESTDQEIMLAARNKARVELIPKFSPEFLYNSTARLELARIDGLADALNRYREQNGIPLVANSALSHIAQSLKAQAQRKNTQVPTIERSQESHSASLEPPLGDTE